MSIGPQDNIAATAAVTAIRSPFRNKFLAPETDTPASALSGLRENFDAIDKHGAGNCHCEPILSSRAHARDLAIALPSPQARKRLTECEIPSLSNLVAIHILFIVSSPITEQL
jgi:hypothetical protein